MFEKLNRLINKIEIILGREYLFSRPYSAQIEPTNRCNQRCIMCPRTDGLDVPIGDLSLDNFKKIIDQLPYLEDLLLNGLGEPLLNKGLPGMVSCATQKGVRTGINTNCALMTQELAGQLIDSGLYLAKISMDSSSPTNYQSIRGAKLEPTIQGIKNLVQTRQQKQSKRPSIWFNSIIMKNNYQEMINILGLAEELNIDMVRFKPINLWDLDSNQDLALDPEVLKAHIQKTIQKSKQLNVHHNLTDILKNLHTYNRPKENLPCYAPWRELYVQYYGGVRLCCEFYSGSHDVGNMLEEKFSQIWNNKKMRNIRRRFKKGDTYFSVCQHCNRFRKNLTTYNKIQNFKKRCRLAP